MSHPSFREPFAILRLPNLISDHVYISPLLQNLATTEAELAYKR